MLTPRIERLLLRLRAHYDKPRVLIDRAKIITESYKETEGLPMILRRALALKKIAEKIPIYVREDELIVGSDGPEPRDVQLFPEFSIFWIEDELNSFDQRSIQAIPFTIDESDKNELLKILDYWKGKTVFDRALSLMPDECLEMMNEDMFSTVSNLTYGIGHFAPNYEKVITKGLKGIIKEIDEEKMKILESLSLVKGEVAKDFIEKLDTLNAMKIAAESLIVYAKRHAEKARLLAEREKDPQRKKELEELAKICEWVPENPARTFHEALQSFWFVHHFLRLESNGVALTPGRMDQYLFPYYEKDLKEGRINKEKAEELLACLWIKFEEENVIIDKKTQELALTSSPERQQVTIGGMNQDGNDATNELSYLILHIDAELKLPQPSLTARIHSKTPKEFLHAVANSIATSRTGKPILINDDIMIQALLLRKPAPKLEEARNYVIVGCVEPTIPGKEFPNCAYGKLNLVKLLILAINNGTYNGKQIGPRTETPKTFEDLLKAYREQFRYFFKLSVLAENANEIAHAELCPLPLASLLVEDCIKKGADLTRGGAKYNYAGIQFSGFATTVDSLYALKKVIFEDRILSLEELRNILETNFEGHEELRNILLNKIPKFGNDIDDIDFVASELIKLFYEEVTKYTTIRGGIFLPGVFPATTHVIWGKKMCATPDGRKAGEPFSDTLSPSQGRDKHGVTAVLRSLAKLDHKLLLDGGVVNIKFNPGALKTERDLENLISLIKSYFSLGGMELTINVVSKEELIEAQKHPEMYQDLVVKVTNWCARFVALSKELQDEIIARTSHEW